MESSSACSTLRSKREPQRPSAASMRGTCSRSHPSPTTPMALCLVQMQKIKIDLNKRKYLFFFFSCCA